MEDEDYEVNKSEQKKADRTRADANNVQNVKNAADIAVASGHPIAAAAGGTVKAVDAATGGKGSEIVGKALTRANEFTPGGRILQSGLNKANESGIGDVAGKAASIKNKANASKGGDTPNQVKKEDAEGGEKKDSLPSSDDKNKNQQSDIRGTVPKQEDDKGKDDSDVDNQDSDSSTVNTKSSVKMIAGVPVAGGLIMIGVMLLPMLLLFLLIASTGGILSNYDDAFGISAAQGEDIGGMVYNASSQVQIDFFNRILEVKEDYQNDGKNVDPLKIVAVYTVMRNKGAALTYDTMTTEVIEDIADCMFSGTAYSEDTFKNNLINDFIPTYLPNTSEKDRQNIVKEIFEYIDNYYDLVGKEVPSGCSSTGTCNYNIEGFYIDGSGNVKNSLQVSNLYVRLMQCGTSGSYNYGGQWGLPLPGEELVPFEKYILGVAYAEIGSGAPTEAIKAQMIAARSYILARPTAAGGSSSWRSLKEENGKWVLQAAACTADQVYCDPDQGCSSNNGQASQVHSGLGHGTGMQRNPLPEDSPLRQYAAETQGEVLVNSNGYVIYTPYTSTEQNQFMALARNGYNYKQIMMQMYNKFGASDIYKASCGNCISNSNYANWKQYEGEWINVPIGTSGRTIKNIGCLATSMAIQIARSGVSTNVSGEFNPGSFVQYLNDHGGFSGGDLNWSGPTTAAPGFVLENDEYLSGMSKNEKLNRIRVIVSQPGVYAVCEVKGNTGQHWVAIDSVSGNTINMMDPGSTSTDMWATYEWYNTSRIVYYKVS